MAAVLTLQALCDYSDDDPGLRVGGHVCPVAVAAGTLRLAGRSRHGICLRMSGCRSRIRQPIATPEPIRETAEAVRFDVRWKVAVSAPLDDPGFDPSSEMAPLFSGGF